MHVLEHGNRAVGFNSKRIGSLLRILREFHPELNMVSEESSEFLHDIGECDAISAVHRFQCGRVRHNPCFEVLVEQIAIDQILVVVRHLVEDFHLQRQRHFGQFREKHLEQLLVDHHY